MRRLTCVATCAGALLIAASAATASTPYDLRGTWRDTNSYGYVAQFTITTMDLNTGQFSGTFGTNATITGTVNGTSLTEVLRDNTSSYTSNISGTVSSSGNAISGSFQDSAGHNGTYSDTRLSGPPSSTTTSTSTTTVTSTSTSTGPKPAAMTVSCTYRTATFDFLCTVQVADRAQPPHIPSGNVVFTATQGGFNPGGTCSLQPPTNGVVSYCSVVYDPPSGGIPAGNRVPVNATYGGDANVGGASAGTSAANAPGVPPAVGAPGNGQNGQVPVQVSCPLYVACAPATIVVTPSSAGVPTPSSAGVPGPSSIGGLLADQLSDGFDALGARAGHGRHASKRPVILGRLQVKVGPRHRLTAHVKLNSQGRARLRRAQHHTMRVRVTVFSDGRVRRTGVVRVRL